MFLSFFIFYTHTKVSHKCILFILGCWCYFFLLVFFKLAGHQTRPFPCPQGSATQYSWTLHFLVTFRTDNDIISMQSQDSAKYQEIAPCLQFLHYRFCDKKTSNTFLSRVKWKAKQYTRHSICLPAHQNSCVNGYSSHANSINLNLASWLCFTVKQKKRV